jgi:hypothetical protein
VSDFQSWILLALLTWAFGPGWFVSRLRRFLRLLIVLRSATAIGKQFKEAAEKVDLWRGVRNPGRPNAKALGYQPLVFVGIFAGLKRMLKKWSYKPKSYLGG